MPARVSGSVSSEQCRRADAWSVKESTSAGTQEAHKRRSLAVFTARLRFFMVREVGLEPTRHCCRQDLNLVRLPISPLTRIFSAEAEPP